MGVHLMAHMMKKQSHNMSEAFLECSHQRTTSQGNQRPFSLQRIYLSRFIDQIKSFSLIVCYSDMQSLIESLSASIKIALYSSDTEFRTRVISDLSNSPELMVIESTDKFVVPEDVVLPDVAVIYAPDSITRTIQTLCESLKRRNSNILILVLVHLC